jgi:hypothetical protein
MYDAVTDLDAAPRDEVGAIAARLGLEKAGDRLWGRLASLGGAIPRPGYRRVSLVCSCQGAPTNSASGTASMRSASG